MIWFLRIAFSVVLVSMLTVTSWASLQLSIMRIPHEVIVNPWFIATLFDCYFGFLTFYVWVAYKENSPVARLSWLAAILLLGNIAMSVYVLVVVFRLPADATMKQVLLRREMAVTK